jgi:hypothetical protein
LIVEGWVKLPEQAPPGIPAPNADGRQVATAVTPRCFRSPSASLPSSAPVFQRGNVLFKMASSGMRHNARTRHWLQQMQRGYKYIMVMTPARPQPNCGENWSAGSSRQSTTPSANFPGSRWNESSTASVINRVVSVSSVDVGQPVQLGEPAFEQVVRMRLYYPQLHLVFLIR